jgi:HSP20 family protein
MMRTSKEIGLRPKASEGLLRRGGAYDPFAWVQQVDRWFDELRREFDRSWPAWTGFGAPLAKSETVRGPAVDVRDNGAEFVVTAELPGVSKDDVEIQATPMGLEIRAEARKEREEKDDSYVYRERNYTGFYRRLPLPAEIDPEKVVATLKDGTLEVRLPKQEPTPASKAVKVKVQ